MLRDKNTGTDCRWTPIHRGGVCDDERLYYLTDANMNVTCLVGTDGAAVERYRYDPYGRFTVYTGTWGWRSAPAYDNSILYCGYYRDNETGLYHVRNRDYHVLLGTWVQRDPKEYLDGMSLYAYAGSNGIANLDGLGLATVRWENVVTENSKDGGEIIVNFRPEGNSASISVLSTVDRAKPDRVWLAKRTHFCAGTANKVRFCVSEDGLVGVTVEWSTTTMFLVEGYPNPNTKLNWETDGFARGVVTEPGKKDRDNYLQFPPRPGVSFEPRVFDWDRYSLAFCAKRNACYTAVVVQAAARVNLADGPPYLPAKALGHAEARITVSFDVL